MKFYVNKNCRCGRSKVGVEAGKIYNIPTDYDVELAGAITQDFEDLTSLGLAKKVVTSLEGIEPTKQHFYVTEGFLIARGIIKPAAGQPTPNNNNNVRR